MTPRTHIPASPPASMQDALLDIAGLDRLLALLREDGYQLIGPTVRDHTIVYGEIQGVADLPRGMTLEQAPGKATLMTARNSAFFACAAPATTLKAAFYPAEEALIQVRHKDGRLLGEPLRPEAPPVAVIGARACDLHALQRLDRILLDPRHADGPYATRRTGAFLVAVQCATPSGTCFCASMGTGPEVGAGHDLALTEVTVPGPHRFLARAGSPRGAALLKRVPHRAADDRDRRLAAAIVQEAAGRMGRTLDAGGVKALLDDNLEHPRWADVAERCLACGNCTMVCPTCFCAEIVEQPALSADESTRVRMWDSCFTSGHSYVHGRPVRASVRGRYRQWLTHKLASWIDQFGTSGCVGCGRCITWCPVGIDITAEVAAIQASTSPAPPEKKPIA